MITPSHMLFALAWLVLQTHQEYKRQNDSQKQHPPSTAAQPESSGFFAVNSSDDGVFIPGREWVSMRGGFEFRAAHYSRWYTYSVWISPAYSLSHSISHTHHGTSRPYKRQTRPSNCALSPPAAITTPTLLPQKFNIKNTDVAYFNIIHTDITHIIVRRSAAGFISHPRNSPRAHCLAVYPSALCWCL